MDGLAYCPLCFDNYVAFEPARETCHYCIIRCRDRLAYCPLQHNHHHHHHQRNCHLVRNHCRCGEEKKNRKTNAIDYIWLISYILLNLERIESICHNFQLLFYKLMYNSKNNVRVYQDFRHLLYKKNYKINPQTDTNLQLHGDFTAAFITGCKNISEYGCVVPYFEWGSDWTEEELKNLKNEITVSDIDRIYNVSYRQHEGKKCDNDFDEFHELRFYVRVRYKNKMLYILSRQNFSHFYYDNKETRYGPGYTLVCTNPIDFGMLYCLEFSNDKKRLSNDVKFLERDGIYVFGFALEEPFSYYIPLLFPFYPLFKIKLKEDLYIPQEYTHVRESYDSTVCEVESHWKNNSGGDTKNKNLKEDLKRVVQITAGVIGIGFLTYQLKKKFF